MNYGTKVAVGRFLKKFKDDEGKDMNFDSFDELEKYCNRAIKDNKKLINDYDYIKFKD
jgi:hypothetical protein